MGIAFIKVILTFTTLCFLVIFFKILWFRKDYKQSYKFCLLNLVLIIIWNIIVFVNESISLFIGYHSYFLYFLSTLLEFYLPCILVIISNIIIKNRITFNKYLIFIPPVISTVVHLTNRYHGLFYRNYDSIKGEFYNGGFYLPFHLMYFFGYILFSVLYVMYYFFRYNKSISKQSFIFLFAHFIPLSFLFFSMAKNYLPSFPFEPYTRAMLYFIYAVMISYAINKYGFFNIVTFGIQNVVDNISDSYIITDLKGNILDRNKSFVDKLSFYFSMDIDNIFNIKIQEDRFLDLLQCNFNVTKEKISGTHFEYEFNTGNENKYYRIELKPIETENLLVGMLIMFKDVSDHKQILKLMEENTNQLIEKARLLSLNQLIGGIAHNIKTPLMSSAGGVLALTKFTQKLDCFFENENIYIKFPEYNETIKEMLKWENNIKQYLIYISEIISTVKDQSVSLNSNNIKSFRIKEIYEKLNLLMGFELKKSGCFLEEHFNIDPQTCIEGDITVLTQILGNLIINSIQACKDGGQIDFTVSGDDNNIVFTVRDYGIGIEEDVKKKLFTQMITTKGKYGTGIGLYISNIALQGHFKGTMGLQKNVSPGTGVFISIPRNK